MTPVQLILAYIGLVTVGTVIGVTLLSCITSFLNSVVSSRVQDHFDKVDEVMNEQA